MAPEDPDRDVAIVLAAYEAFARGDIEAAVQRLHPGVEWIEPDEFPNGGRHVGPDAVADYLRSSRAAWGDVVSERTAHRRGGNVVVVHHASGRLLDGSDIDATVADVFTLRDGVVVKMQAYADPAEVLGPG